MKTEVIDNYLPKDVFEDLQKYIICQYFPWFYQPYIGNDQDSKEHVFLASTFYDNNSPRENWYWERLCLPILRTFKYKALLRIKANLYLNQTKIITHNPHIDFDFPHVGALMFWNTNNGSTIIDDKPIKSIANRMVFFDASKPHTSTTQSDEKTRVTMIFSYIA